MGVLKSFGVLVLIKQLEFLGRNWYLFSKSKNVGGGIALLAPPLTRALRSSMDLDHNLKFFGGTISSFLNVINDYDLLQEFLKGCQIEF